MESGRRARGRQHLDLGPLLSRCTANPTPRTSRRTRCSRRWPPTRSTRSSARSSRATRTAIRTCSPTCRARSITSAAVGSCSASARAGSSATTTSTATSSGPRPSRLRDLRRDLPIIMDRFSRLEPPPTGRLPILIGGSGEKVTLRLVAEFADAWNTFGPPENFAQKNRVLDEWCARARPEAESDRTHRRDQHDRDRHVAGVPRCRCRAPDRDGRSPVRPRPGRASPGCRPRLTRWRSRPS